MLILPHKNKNYRYLSCIQKSSVRQGLVHWKSFCIYTTGNLRLMLFLILYIHTLYAKVLSPCTKLCTAHIFRYKPKRKEAIPSWELRTGKPTATAPNTHNAEMCNPDLWRKGLPKKSEYDQVPLQSTFLGEALQFGISVKQYQVILCNNHYFV